MRSIAALSPCCLSRRASRVLGEILRERGEVELQARERLAQLVVDLARDVDALLLAHRLQVPGERAQVLLRGAQALLGEGARSASSAFSMRFMSCSPTKTGSFERSTSGTASNVPSL